MFRRIKDINKKIVNIFKKVVLRKKVYELDDFNYEKLEKLMSDKGTLQEFKNDLDNFSEIDNLMQNNTRLHGTNHVLRVVFNTYALATLENISEEDKKIIIAAAKLHDIGKVADGEDRAHGETSANKAKVVLKEKGYTQEEIEQICFIIKEHSLPKDKNIEDIENLPQELKERYKRNLNMLKDADKLDRVRLGDLDQSRLTTSSAKRLIPISMDNFRENRYYYEVKPKIYYFNVEQAKEILDFIKEANPNIDIEFKDIRNKYSIYKSLQEQGKLKWIELYKNNIKEDMSIDVFIDIISNLNEQDIDIIQKQYHIGIGIIIAAINEMGINKFIQLKHNGQLNRLLNIKTYKGIYFSSEEKKNQFIDILKFSIRKEDIEENYYL